MNILTLIPARAWLYLALGACLLTIGGIGGWTCHVPPAVTDGSADTILTRDTLTVHDTIIPAARIVVRQIPVAVITRDSIHDTVIRYETANCYQAKETEKDGAVIGASFCSRSFQLEPPPDLQAHIDYTPPIRVTTTITLRDTIFKPIDRPWYQNPIVCLAAGIAGGALADQAINQLTKK
jgi:hypothetical protein